MISSEDLVHESRFVTVNVGRNRFDRRCKSAPQANPALDCTAARILDPWNWNAPLRGFRWRIAKPYIHVNRDIEFRLPCGGDLVHVARLMIKLKKFIGVPAENRTPRARLFVGR